jgi:TolB-like protein
VTELERIFQEALALPVESRSVYLAHACKEDALLLDQVHSLLSHAGHSTEGFLAVIEPVAAEWTQSSTPALDLTPGQSFGRYRIDAKVGEGGMGAVYRAFDTKLERQVAIKLLRRILGQPAAALQRFHAEARSAAALSHPNIATLHDSDETDGLPWLVIEYVAGTSLRDKLRDGPLSAAAVLRYAKQIAEALGHAHSRGIVHRDIKPENILIGDDGLLKIIDFGIARILAEAVTEDTFIGTPAYTAPELLTGGEATPASDVFSFGLVVHEMLAGCLPSSSRDWPEGSAPTLTAVIERCLSASPWERYPNGVRLAAALRSLALPEPVAQRDPIAVVDFSNRSGDPTINWLSVGLAETLSARLAKLDSIQVIRLSKVRELTQNSSHAPDPVSLAASLPARWVVSGSFQKHGDRLRVHTELFDAHSDADSWNDTVDGLWPDLFEIQDTVSSHIANEIAKGSDRRLSSDTRNLLAYEHFAKGRDLMHQMHPGALADAIRQFEEALVFDPDYALALSSLGTCCALQFLRTSNPEDIKRAGTYLERAIALDPELGEPYPWLANIRLRKNDSYGSFAAGLKGIQLQPDLTEAHYFYGGIHYMAAECGIAAPKAGLASFAEALRLQPKFHPAWLGLGALNLFLGQHQSAIEVLDEAIRREGSPGLIFPFVGAHTLRATAILRQGLWQEALASFDQALTHLEQGPDHLYRNCFLTLSACGLGDAALRLGDPSAAAAHFRRGWRIVHEAPRMVGSQRLLIRTAAGLASSYVAMGETARARELYEASSAQLVEVGAQLATLNFECGLAQLNLSLAVASIRLGDLDRAADHLRQARASGWLDAIWLRVDSELEPLHAHPAYVDWLAELDAALASGLSINGNTIP